MQLLLCAKSGCVVLEKSLWKLLFLVMEDKEDDVTVVLQAFG